MCTDTEYLTSARKELQSVDARGPFHKFPSAYLDDLFLYSFISLLADSHQLSQRWWREDMNPLNSVLVT